MFSYKKFQIYFYKSFTDIYFWRWHPNLDWSKPNYGIGGVILFWFLSFVGYFLHFSWPTFDVDMRRKPFIIFILCYYSIVCFKIFTQYFVYKTEFERNSYCCNTIRLRYFYSFISIVILRLIHWIVQYNIYQLFCLFEISSPNLPCKIWWDSACSCPFFEIQKFSILAHEHIFFY